jgi:hypothetical protein
MPSYQNAVPPSWLSPGDVGFSFNNETFPGSAQAGSQFAIPSYAGQPDTWTAVPWQTIFGTAPTAVSLILQGAMADVDTEYPDHRHHDEYRRRSSHRDGSASKIFAYQVFFVHRWIRAHGKTPR